MKWIGGITVDKNINIKFVETLFERLKSQNIRYCILRNADEVERGDAHDIDMTVEEEHTQDFEKLALEVAQTQGWRLHLKTGSAKDTINIKCYHFYKAENSKIHIVHFDVFPTFSWGGYMLLDNAVLINNIDTSSLYHKSSPEVEAVTKLFIRLLHNGYIKSKYKEYIKSVFEKYPEKVNNTLLNFLDAETSTVVQSHVLSEEWNLLEEDRNQLVRIIKKNAQSCQIRYKLYLAKKILKKPGIMVAFEGTDGSGKSTIIDGLRKELANTFPEGMFDYYHWRPGFIKSENKMSNGKAVVVTQPHAEKPYGKIKSFAKFMFFNIDYVLGYWCKVRWQLAKGHLVVFDRYYYDYYMDKIRYRLNLSDKTLNTFRFLIPKPDVTLLLIGNSQILYERKKEISVEEIEAQMNNLIRNKEKFHNSKYIDVNKEIDKVVFDVSSAILSVRN